LKDFKTGKNKGPTKINYCTQFSLKVLLQKFVSCDLFFTFWKAFNVKASYLFCNQFCLLLSFENDFVTYYQNEERDSDNSWFEIIGAGKEVSRLLLTFFILLPLLLLLMNVKSVPSFPASNEVKVEADFAIGTNRQLVHVFAENYFLQLNQSISKSSSSSKIN
jgi:hypothetical protein